MTRIKATVPANILKKKLSDSVSRDRLEHLKRGFVYAGNKYQVDSDAMVSIMTVAMLLLAGGQLPDGFGWRDINNVMVPMTAAQFRQFAIAAGQTWVSVYKASFELKDSLEASENPELIDTNIGWPI